MSRSGNGPKRDKARLAKLMGQKEGTDSFEFVWEELSYHGPAYDWWNWIMTDEQILEDAGCALDRYKRFIGKGRSYPSGKREEQEQEEEEGEGQQDIPVEPSKREMDATEALREYLAAHAAKRPLVQRFRKECLPNDELLAYDIQIGVYLEESLGTDLWGPDLDNQKYLEQVLALYRRRQSNSTPFPLGSEPPSGEGPRYTHEEVAQKIAEYQSRQERRLEERWVDPDAIWARRDIAEPSREVGRLLEELGEWLVNVYPWSEVGDAVVFVVSGRPPRLVEPLSAAMDLGTAQYSITFSRWVSEASVLRAYRTIASHHHHPAPGDKTIRVLSFVSEQADEEGRLPTWSKLLELWNEKYPKDRYLDRSALRRAYARAVEALVPPYLPLGLEDYTHRQT